jgi:hypothetical protein
VLVGWRWWWWSRLREREWEWEVLLPVKEDVEEGGLVGLFLLLCFVLPPLPGWGEVLEVLLRVRWWC